MIQGLKDIKTINTLDFINKAVKGIGEIICIVDVDYHNKEDDLMVISSQFGVLTDKQKIVLKKVIKEAHSDFGYDIACDHRFFFVDKYHETNFIKVSKNGMMGKRYYDVSIMDGYDKKMNAEKIADLLRDKSWK
jgi:hypothetical protein